MILDKWQQEVVSCVLNRENIVVRSSRQAGKSTAISIAAAEFAAQNKNKLIMIVASVERQAYLLFDKTLNYLYDKHRKLISTGKDRPTRHIIKLKNKSTIMCLPTGISGTGIRGFTTDLLIIDEAAFVPSEVFVSIVPQLSVSNGKLVLLSTPFGKGSYFHDCFNDPNFKKWHIRWEDCPRINKEFIAREKIRMTKLQFMQEYEAEFIDELRQFFPTELIRACMKIERGKIYEENKDFPTYKENYLGADIAAMGEDETVISTFEKRKWQDKNTIRQKDMDIAIKQTIPQTIRKIIEKDKVFKHQKIYIDDGGVGVGVFHGLLEEDQTKRKTIAINNASRPLNRDGSKNKKILKEDLYNNLLRLMEAQEIEFFNEPEVLHSLMSVQYENTDKGTIKIFGKYTHIAESFIRAVWCMREKSLSIWVR